MANVRIELNSAGIQELLKSQELRAVCEAEARRMTEATGVEYRSDVQVGRYRVRAGARYFGDIGARSLKGGRLGAY